ncbi:MAG: M20 family metallo-hydrolase [Burkholderiaceae bacterium]
MTNDAASETTTQISQPSVVAPAHINADRLIARLEDLARIGPIPNGGSCRLALTDEDREARDWLVDQMKSLGMTVKIDQIGNIIGIRPGKTDQAPVMTGSHIDTVRTGGRFDGNLGVLAGLEVIQTLNDTGVVTQRPIAVAAFTDEEGARFAPDMLGSLVYVGGMDVEDALDIVGIDGARLGDELTRIGYAGNEPVGALRPHAFVELHIEQGPVLDIENITIGAVEDLQGISWQSIAITGQSNHAGTTPMRLRHDAGYCAAAIGVFLRNLASEIGGNQVCTVGKIDLHPNLVNVIAARATLTADLRNTDEAVLQAAEQALADYLKNLAQQEGVEITTEKLARFEPVTFDTRLVNLIQAQADKLGLSCQKMTSGAGHDAQMLARWCPSAMVFVPSIDGISHNPAERTHDKDLVAGANVLLNTLLSLCDE